MKRSALILLTAITAACASDSDTPADPAAVDPMAFPSGGELPQAAGGGALGAQEPGAEVETTPGTTPTGNLPTGGGAASTPPVDPESPAGGAGAGAPIPNEMGGAGGAANGAGGAAGGGAGGAGGSNDTFDPSWTVDEFKMGVRWQPHPNVADPVFLAQDEYLVTDSPVTQVSDFVYIWIFWNYLEPPGTGTDLKQNPSWQGYYQHIKRAHEAGLKVHLVLTFTPAWAYYGVDPTNTMPESEYVRRFGYRNVNHFAPRDPAYYADFCRRIEAEVGDMVGAYDLWHEANLSIHWRNRFNGTTAVPATFGYQLETVRLGAEAMKQAYAASGRHVELSYAGTSPCGGCDSPQGLSGDADAKLNSFYDQIIGDTALMNSIDNVALNVSDTRNGFGAVGGVTSSWGQMELMRTKLDAAGFQDKGIAAAENWIVWDDRGIDHNKDGRRDELDTPIRAVRLISQVIHRGLNNFSLPAVDNSSPWAMGLTKVIDITGQYAASGLRTSANTFGEYANMQAPIVMDKFNPANNSVMKTWSNNTYANVNNPVHLHFYLFRWFAQLSAGKDQTIRHALPASVEPLTTNQLLVNGTSPAGGDPAFMSGYSADQREVAYAATWNRDQDEFIVIVYSPGETGNQTINISMPSTIQAGTYYNNAASVIDFRGEGIPADAEFDFTWETKNISFTTGADEQRATGNGQGTASGGNITVEIPSARKFTTVKIQKK